MGSTNFIVMDKLKLAIEINRNANDDIEYPEYEFEVPETEVKLSEIKVSDIGKVFDYISNVPQILNDDEFLLLWVQRRGYDYKIISETEFYETDKKYDNYKILNPF